MTKNLSSENEIPSLIVKNQDLLICPACGSRLNIDSSEDFECASCRRTFPIEGRIPLLFWPDEAATESDVTEIVKAFYEENPFPNYEGLDSAWSLRQKANEGVFAKLLDDQVPPNAKILEVGCGTGQLSNFLGLTWGRTVFGADLCLNSLKLGHAFNRANQVNQTAFLQMNLFKPIFRPKSFDLVISNGVLHHTSDPFKGFMSIADLVKEGGHIIIGLYNRIGRLPTDTRRLVFRATGGRLKRLDPRLRAEGLGEVRKQTWYSDQYEHPHESKHSIDEVLDWFAAANFSFVNSVPKLKAFQPFQADEELFVPSPIGDRIDHVLVQFSILLRGGREGGFFVMIGKREPGQ